MTAQENWSVVKLLRTAARGLTGDVSRNGTGDKTFGRNKAEINMTERSIFPQLTSPETLAAEPKALRDAVFADAMNEMAGGIDAAPAVDGRGRRYMTSAAAQ